MAKKKEIKEETKDLQGTSAHGKQVTEKESAAFQNDINQNDNKLAEENNVTTDSIQHGSAPGGPLLFYTGTVSTEISNEESDEENYGVKQNSEINRLIEENKILHEQVAKYKEQLKVLDSANVGQDSKPPVNYAHLETTFNYKYKTGDIVMLQSKHQKMKFQVTHYQGSSQNGEPLYKVSNFNFNITENLVLESLLSPDDSQGFKQ